MDMIFAFLRTTFAAIIVTIALGGSAMADDTPLKIIVHPGQSEADVEQVLDFAARSGRPVAIEVGQAAAVSSGTVAAVPVAVTGNAGPHACDTNTGHTDACHISVTRISAPSGTCSNRALACSDDTDA